MAKTRNVVASDLALEEAVLADEDALAKSELRRIELGHDKTRVVRPWLTKWATRNVDTYEKYERNEPIELKTERTAEPKTERN